MKTYTTYIKVKCNDFITFFMRFYPKKVVEITDTRFNDNNYDHGHRVFVFEY